MGLSFANLFGLLALAGIPAILVIHLFQRRSRRVPISTLFLLEASTPQGEAGRTRQRLRRSASLWLQLAAVLLLTWLLIQPRWLRAESVQRTVVVLDGSLSMDAFRPAAAAALEKLARSASRLAQRREWTLLASDVRESALYSGDDPGAMVASLRAWRPRIGAHDPRAALRAARGVAGPTGRVVYLTDHDGAVEPGVDVLGVGAPIENVGFAGVRVEEQEGGKARWRAVVHNYGRADAERAWRIVAGTIERPGGTSRIPPGGSEVLSGEFPEGVTSLTLALDPDGFAVDDRLPIARPSPKRLVVGVSPAAKETPFVTGFLRTLDAVDEAPAGGGARRDLDVDLRGPGPLAPDAGAGAARSIVFLSAPAKGRDYVGGPIIAENDPLMEDLTWQGLLLKDTATIPAAPGDAVLLWQGTRPLIFLRETGGGLRLVLDFPVEESNAARLPSFVLLLHRFAESARRAKVAPERSNVEIGQRLELAVDPAGPPLSLMTEEGAEDRVGIPPAQVALLRAPVRPGVFEVRQGSVPLLTASAHFADVREADFQAAVSKDAALTPDAAVVMRNSRADPFASLWTVLLAGLLVADWMVQGRRRQRDEDRPTAVAGGRSR